jgi:hypothetical protein
VKRPEARDLKVQSDGPDIRGCLGALTADPLRLKQILLNLLSNACKPKIAAEIDSAALSYLREGEAGDRVPFDLYGATPSGPSSRGSALGASGPAKPTGVFVALLRGRRRMIGCRAVTIGQGRSLPGGDGRPRSTRQ